MKYYTTFFDQGYCGTWFTYFVSIHNGFYKLPLKYVYDQFSPHGYREKTIKPTHAGLPNGFWIKQHYDLVNKKYHPNEYKSQINLQRFLDRLYNQGATVYDKIILKQHPHGLNYNSLPSTDKQVKQQKQFGNFILMSADNHWPKQRHHTVEKRTNAWKESVDHLDKHKLSYCVIDIHLLLKKDQQQYKLLCDYIESDPLPNWKKHVNGYINMIGLSL